MSVRVVATMLIACAVGAGCVGVEHRSTPTQPTSGASLLGAWASGGLGSTAQSCGDFRWRILSQEGNSATGEFSATCRGGITLAGTISGTLSGSRLDWNAAGTAMGPSDVRCPFSLSGTGTLEGDTVRIDYRGTTCAGSISGTEILRR